MPRIGEKFNPYRVFAGVFIPESIYNHKKLTSTAKLLYGRLARFKGEYGDAFPAAKTLAEELGLSERQVFEHLSRLVFERFIEREPRDGQSTVYHFLWHECFEGGMRESALPPTRKSAGGHEETRTTGSAEIRSIRESIEESHLRELPLPPHAASAALVSEPRNEPGTLPGFVSSDRPVGPAEEIELAIQETAVALSKEHPKIRTSGPKTVATLLRRILRAHKVTKAAQQIEYLNRIAANHTAWCRTEEWAKESGRFALSLENWLAPTMNRYADPPPSAAAQGYVAPEFFDITKIL